MFERVDNSDLGIPLEGEMPEGDAEENKLSLEEIETEIKRREKVKEEEKPEAQEEEPEEEEEKEEEEPEGEDKFKDKSTDDVIEMYKNLEKMTQSHNEELGDLRKKVKEYAEKEGKDKELNLQEVERKLFPAMEKWTKEQIIAFFNKFQEDPQGALRDVIRAEMKPYTTSQAANSNVVEVKKLKDLHKDDVVPYVEKEINAIISANEGWWKKYGTGIFEHAYDVFRNKSEVFNKYALEREEKVQMKAKDKDEQERAIKGKTFVEKRGIGGIKRVKVKTIEDYAAIKDPDEAKKEIEKELKRRGVQIE